MDSSTARDRFVLDLRPSRPAHDPWTLQGLSVEDERTADGRIAATATVFLTGRECPWRCMMCDLWRYTIPDDTTRGAIPAQVAAARERLDRESPAVSQIKLYNAGSFFDPRAVPDADYADVAASLRGLQRVVVESHPALIGDRVDRWLDALGAASPKAPALEIAMGLETAHPEALDRLHKRMTLDQFAGAAEAVRERGATVRAFVLMAPPFIPAAAQDEWLLRSVDFAFEAGASVVTLIPTRGGNGALERLSDEGLFRPPTIGAIERSADAALARTRARGRLFVDIWDLERFSSCSECVGDRRARLHTMNLEQRVVPRVACPQCQ